MQIGAQFPVVSHSPSSRNAFPAQNQVVKLNTAPSVEPSSAMEFAGVSAKNESRFSPYGDFGANAKAALNTYQATESLASNNPRHALIGIDTFA